MSMELTLKSAYQKEAGKLCVACMRCADLEESVERDSSRVSICRAIKYSEIPTPDGSKKYSNKLVTITYPDGREVIGAAPSGTDEVSNRQNPICYEVNPRGDCNLFVPSAG